MKLHPLLKDKKLVLFDFDGTLVDSMGMWIDIDRKILEVNGLPVPDGLTERLIPLNEDETAAVFLELGCQGTVQSIRELHDDLAQEQYEQHIQLKVGARELLDTLRANGIRIGIVSASTLTRMLPCINRLGLTGYFNIILPCGEYDVNKHTPEPYRMALQYLNAEAADTVFVDDFYGNVLGAKQAGLSTVGIYDAAGETTWDKMQQSADLSVRSLTELLEEE